MHPFSIEYLTSPAVGKKTDRPWSPASLDSDTPRTPSPASSVSSHSKSPSSSHLGQELDPSVAKALILLERHASSTGGAKRTSEKPEHSYIAMISMAILHAPVKKMLLSDIYQYIMDCFPYYNNQNKAWRNSVRHNLSLNECFIKCGRADNGKGNFWAIHPACVEDFARGDFRRRQARRRARQCNNRVDDGRLSGMTGNVKYSCYVPVDSHTSFAGYHPYSTPSYAQQPPYPVTSQMTPMPMGYTGYTQRMMTSPAMLPSPAMTYDGSAYTSLPSPMSYVSKASGNMSLPAW
ncbi:fork head domain-containing protein FD5-like [Lineus longissimus]|uniref:fork head domain-containing protein FD5-like n=1 Tax=Lineus longissimus TaxID=88925 RepID=UPI00315D1709